MDIEGIDCVIEWVSFHKYVIIVCTHKTIFNVGETKLLNVNCVFMHVRA